MTPHREPIVTQLPNTTKPLRKVLVDASHPMLNVADMEWLDLVHGRQDQVARTVNPVLDIGRFVYHEIIAAFFKGRIAE